jgi:hypothetical protein
MLVTSRRQAASLCEERGARLCHELEWERACKGDETSTYATGGSIDIAACATDPNACASPLGVLDLGVRAAEWTASDADPELVMLDRTVVVRGGRTNDDLALHRCSARQASLPQDARPTAFRCCSGAPLSIAYPDVGQHRVFRDLRDDRARIREALASVPQLARYAQDFIPWGREDGLHALARGNATELTDWEVARGPFSWSPTTGEEVWVIAGTSGHASLIAALYPRTDGTFIHAASFVMTDEPAPIAILRSRGSRGELLWTACWGCGGESGNIRFAEDSRIVIAQQ